MLKYRKHLYSVMWCYRKEVYVLNSVQIHSIWYSCWLTKHKTLPCSNYKLISLHEHNLKDSVMHEVLIAVNQINPGILFPSMRLNHQNCQEFSYQIEVPYKGKILEVSIYFVRILNPYLILSVTWSIIDFNCFVSSLFDFFCSDFNWEMTNHDNSWMPVSIILLVCSNSKLGTKSLDSEIK